MEKLILSAIVGVATGYFIRKIQDKARAMKLISDIEGSEDMVKTKLKTSTGSIKN